MSLSIFTNTASINAQRNLGISQRSLAANLAHLSSGLRINDASPQLARSLLGSCGHGDEQPEGECCRNGCQSIHENPP